MRNGPSGLGQRKRLSDVVAVHKNGEWGFTGTRAGMTLFQRQMMERIFKIGQPSLLRHGGAFGSDFEAHAIWKQMCPGQKSEVWPADGKRQELFMDQPNVTVQPIMFPLSRNIEIVARSVFMLATPHNEVEEQRSGTWHAIREALKVDRPILIIWPFTKRLTLYTAKQLYRVTYTGGGDV